MNKRSAVIFYILSAYVFIQFVWWGYHLIQLTNIATKESSLIQKRIAMIMGEGAVFLLLLLIGIWQIRRSIKRDLKLSQRQNNFLLSVTHELKTPLAANKLYIQTVTKRELTKEQSVEMLNKAIEENNRLERMIDNILNASRLENNALHLNKEHFEIENIYEPLKKRFNLLFGKDIVFVESGIGIQLFADRFMIETVISNLIENAGKYAMSGERIILYAFNQGENVVFGVKDEGSGVSKEFRNEIFKKFFRLEDEETRTRKGSGLGLYIVSKLIQLHGGTIEYIENQPKGANFQIKLRNE